MAESPLGRLIGTWEVEPLGAGRPTGRGRAPFERIEDGAFLLERSHAEWTDPAWVEDAPVSTRAVLGWDDSTGGRGQVYADSRAVSRVDRRTLTDEAWRLERSAPDFHQRFVGASRDGGRTTDGRWESSPDGTARELDVPIPYPRAGGQ